MKFEITIFEKGHLIEEIPDYYIVEDDHLLKESDRLEQEDLDETLKPRIP